ENRHGGLKILVGDWQSAGLAAQGSGTARAAYGVTSLLHLDTPTPPKDADDAWMIDSFTAPEGAWLGATADRVRIDVFGLGALAYYVLAGRPPAASGPALADRLRAQQGLDLVVDVPQIGPGLREAVLAATRPAPSARTADVGTFLTTLDAAETHLPARDEIDVDPLEARAGDVLAGRFRVERRLGQGSTALGLLVTDLATTAELRRVLKVALHDEAAKRLAEEADVLRRVSSPRLVALVEGPLSVHGRQALLLENAGEKTLTEVLRERARLSLDLLERYGTDLLEALVALDAAGVDQRDIKPSNLGVRESRSAGSRDRAKHLVLFDFSLSRAPASAVTAGTPPYLDPFLTGTRATYDSAAERYAASVVLFEMASGGTPVYGDPVAHPAAVPDEATVTADMFDPAVAPALVAFFDRALARDATRRHHTAADMLAVWRAAFPQEITTVAADADELAAAATPTTALARAGLSARALSAIEPLSLTTVGDLIVVDPIRLARLAGVAAPTRTEINSRAKQWRIAHPAGVRRAAPGTTGSAALPPVTDLAQVLLDHTGSRRSTSRTAMVRLVLGVGTDLDAFATQAQLAANLPTARTTARATQLLIALQEAWATDEAARDAVALLENVVDGRLSDLGGVATAHELSLALLQAASPPGLSGAAQVDHEVRRAAGLLRIVVDRRRALAKADVAGETLTTRRRDGRVNLISTSPDLLDVAESLGREADTLVAEAGATGAGTDAVVPAERVQERLVAVVTRAQVGSPALVEPSRLARLAAATSATACVSGALELHHRDLAQATATALALKGISAAQPMTPSELRGRVGVRFPALPALPARPRLDEVLREAGLDLVFDDVRGDYHSPTSGADTTGLQTRMSTHVVVAAAPVSSDGAIGQRLLDSVRRRSFLSLGVRPDRAAKLITVLCGRYNAYVLDVTAVLVTAMR
ncbi:MAG TPA: hypothetical protein VES95_07235, partial [Dermatophilaceae bacterium]|nr:hypothetical protein [Dermatophilaceae bacterium]